MQICTRVQIVHMNTALDTRSVQQNFNLITSFIQGSAGKHIPSKTSHSVSCVLWITPENKTGRFAEKTNAKAKKTGSAKIRSKFEILRRYYRKQHDLYVNNLVGDAKANPRKFYRYINSQKERQPWYPSFKPEDKWSCKRSPDIWA